MEIPSKDPRIRWVTSGFTKRRHILARKDDVEEGSPTFCRLRLIKPADPDPNMPVSMYPVCEICAKGEKELETPEGRLLYELFGTPLASPDARKVASYVCEERSKLATMIRETRQRLEALGTFYDT